MLEYLRMQKPVVLRLIAVLAVLLFITAVVLGAVAMSYEQPSAPFSSDFKRENIKYSSETALRYAVLMAPLFGTGNTLPPFDRIDEFVDNLYTAFSRAGVSEEKLNLILDRVEEMGLKDSSESPILAFIQSAFDTANGGDGDTTLGNIVTEEEVARAISDSFEFLVNANMTVDDVGCVLYETALMYADEKRLDLLVKLGKDNFTMLTVGTYSVYKTASVASEKFSSLTDARILGQALVSLGLFYGRALSAAGTYGIDDLLFLDYRISEGNPSIDSGFAAKYNEITERMYGGAGNIVSVAHHVLISLTPLAFEELYFADAASKQGDSVSSELHSVWAAFDFASSFRKGLKSAADGNEEFTDERSLISYLCGLYADYQLLNDAIYNAENAPSREEYKAEAQTAADEFYGAVNAVHDGCSGFANFDDLAAFSETKPEKFAEILSAAEFILNYEFDLEKSLTDVFSSLTKAAIIRIFTGLEIPEQT